MLSIADAGDLKKLQAQLRAGGASSSAIGKLLQHTSKGVRALTLAWLHEEASRRPGMRAALSVHLPLLPAHTRFEIAVLTADLYRLLGPRAQAVSLPDWRSLDVHPEAQVAWLKAELVIEPPTIERCAINDALLTALDALIEDDALEALGLLSPMIARDSAALGAASLRLIERAVLQGHLLLQDGQAHLLALAISARMSAGTRLRALELLESPWALASPPGPEAIAQLRSITKPDDRVAVAAVALLGAWEAFDALELILRDPERETRVRSAALAEVGRSGRAELIGLMISLAKEGLSSTALFEGLRRMHHRGAFVSPDQIEALLALYLERGGAEAKTLLEITYTARDALMSALEAQLQTAPVEMLVELLEHAHSSRALALLEALLPRTEGHQMQARLLEVLGERGASEALFLQRLAAHPLVCLQALRKVGGAQTARVLRSQLGFETGADSSVAPLAGACFTLALTLLWQLQRDDPAQRRAILERLDPAEVPPQIRADLGPRIDPAELEYLARLRRSTTDAEAIELYCDLGSAQALEAVRPLFAAHVRRLASRRDGTEPSQHGAEPVVFPSVKEAVRGLGGRLYRRSAIRPACLARAQGVEKAKDALLAQLSLELIAESEDPEELRMLLEVLEPLAHPGKVACALRMLRHKSPQVVKMALRCLSQDKPWGLQHNLERLTQSPHPEVVRQAILALQTLGEASAAPAIIAALRHGNMNIKKTAAKALSVLGGPAAIEPLLAQLAHHDNSGFRAQLLESLEAILGVGMGTALLARLARTEESRATRLLIEALDRQLDPPLVDAYMRGHKRGGAALMRALEEGRIRLRSGELSDLAPVKSRRGPATQDPLHALRKMRSETGWQERIVIDHLESLVPSAEALSSPLRAVLASIARAFPREWLRMLQARAPAQKRIALEALLGPHALAGPAREDEALLEHLCAEQELLLDCLAQEVHRPLHPRIVEVLVALGPRFLLSERLRAARAIRIAPPLIASRVALRLDALRALGVLVTAEDLVRTLEDLDVGRPSREATRAVLLRAFALPDAPVSSASTQVVEATLEAAPHASAPEVLAQLEAAMKEMSPSEALRILAEVVPDVPRRLRASLIGWMSELRPPDVRWSFVSAVEAPGSARETSGETEAQAMSWARLPEALEEPSTRLLAARWALRQREPKGATSVLPYYLRDRLKLESEEERALALHLLEVLDSLALPTEPRELQRLSALLLRLPAPARRRALPWVVRMWSEGAAPLEPVLSRAFVYELLPFVPQAPGLARLWSAPTPVSAAVHADLQEKLRKTTQEQSVDQAGVQAVLKTLSTPLSSDPSERERREQQRMERLTEVPAAKPPAPQQQLKLLLADTRSDNAPKVRAALKALGRIPGAQVEQRLLQMIEGGAIEYRQAALRALKRVAKPQVYLAAVMFALEDPRPDVVRAALRTLGHSGYAPALEPTIALLFSKNTQVRRASEDALRLFGERATGALLRAIARARPDRRIRLQEALDRIAQGEDAG